MNQAKNIDFVMDRFMQLIDGIRPSFQNGISDTYKYYPIGNRSFDVHEMSKLIIEMQKGEYFNLKDGEKLRLANSDQEIGINFASSGQQEILWLLNFLYVLMLRNERSFVIIEEPEAHIYPTLQKKIIDFISMFVNISDSRVFVTTHSPYVLTAMNNLYYAGILASEEKLVIYLP